MGLIEGYEYKIPFKSQDKLKKVLRLEEGDQQEAQNISKDLYGFLPY